MSLPCTHLPEDLSVPELSAGGCTDCIAMGRSDWIHLRFCQSCGHVGCCDDSPQTHATVHSGATGHAIVRSFEPGEDWWYCYVDDVILDVEGSPRAPSHS